MHNLSPVTTALITQNEAEAQNIELCHHKEQRTEEAACLLALFKCLLSEDDPLFKILFIVTIFSFG